MVLRRVLARLVAAASLAATVSVLAASGASASTHQYCGVGVNPYADCLYSLDAPSSLWDNAANYTGVPAISVCEKVLTNAGQISRRCAAGYRDSASDLDPYAGVAMEGFVGNNSGYVHTIYGIGYDYN